MSEEYTAQSFLKALSSHIKENDGSLNEGAEKGGHSYRFGKSSYFKIRVTANLDNSGKIAVSIYRIPSDQRQEISQRMVDLGKSLPSSFRVTSSTIWIKERICLSNSKTDIAWVTKQIDKLKQIINFLEGGAALPEELICRDDYRECISKKDTLSSESKRQHVSKQIAKETTGINNLSLKCEKFVELGDTEIPDAHGKLIPIKKMASWALWYPPKDGDYNSISNMYVGQMFTEELEQTLPLLQPDVMLLGINCSRPPEDDSDIHWQNFHLTNEDKDTSNGSSSTTRPGKSLRFGCHQTFLRGAYFTDLFKNWVDLNSQKVSKYFESEEHADELEACAESFAQEMAALRRFSGSQSPLTIVCFGDAVYEFLQRKEFLDKILKVIGNSLLLVGWLNHYAYLPKCHDEEKMDLFTEQIKELESIRNAVLSNIGTSTHRGVLFLKKPECLDDKCERLHREK